MGVETLEKLLRMANSLRRIAYRGDMYWTLPALPAVRRYSTCLRKEIGVAVGLHKRASIPGTRNRFYSSNRKLGFTLKTHTCGELCIDNVGEEVTLRGFLQYQRMGKFAVLRDYTGKTQILVRDEDVRFIELLNNTTFESYIEVKGRVCSRPEDQFNKNMPTGEIEIVADDVKVLSAARQNLPYLIRDYNKPKENLRLKYRYLDLRHAEMQNNLRLRSKVAKKMRDYLQDKENFVEITTPTLSVNTPGGAQEFIVPTRLPGKFYSLVQSPQTYKQLAMIGGFERYFQFAVCYRDEGAKADRQPEFLQVDLEMADVTMAEIQQLIENLLIHCWPDHLPAIKAPFPSMTYEEAMTAYGVDKPDTRFEWKLQNVTEIIKGCGAKVLETAAASPENSACCFVIPGGQKYMTRKLVSSWESLAEKDYQLKGPSVFTVREDMSLQGPLAKKINNSSQSQLIERLGAHAGDAVVLAVGSTSSVQSLLGKLRLLSANTLEEAGVVVRNPSEFKFLWVVDFPLFEMDEDGRKLVSVHHPFTLPKEEDTHYLHTDPIKARSQHYDLVLNGCEIGGGSMRIYEPSMQQHVLENILGIDASSLGFFNEALQSGAPPHGGIALGFDRLIAELCGAKSIRDVIAFPKSIEGRCYMSGAPGSVTTQEMDLYHIRIKESEEKRS
ncbi:aspartate--tRNA ligase, mitochondrial-like [Penaeus japonicus]|uniref:aspartate--tRNA ligase, mitochondrial-like n=1 Tax=Penaeus japonicus TaxID=27405 RepID=UPI001C713173|nr:aspartate--tRNA ligase, mitochondrial-like [Penaeus japonicus]